MQRKDYFETINMCLLIFVSVRDIIGDAVRKGMYIFLEGKLWER